MKFPYDADYFPPAPSVEIQLSMPGGSFIAGPLRAFVDTGADVLLVPFRHIEPLGAQIDNRKYLRSQWGERRIVDVYLLDVGIGGLRLPLVEVVADDRSDEVIVGRNVLSRLIVTLNGPKQELEIVG